ncbi:hypothetical protein EV401DRAFT_1463019 [Pisolithus croceorrhizus]|nr:hypothetical protein EV401DRAFT_1463019 [Pisolithus croceorrhizus]
MQNFMIIFFLLLFHTLLQKNRIKFATLGKIKNAHCGGCQHNDKSMSFQLHNSFQTSLVMHIGLLLQQITEHLPRRADLTKAYTFPNALGPQVLMDLDSFSHGIDGDIMGRSYKRSHRTSGGKPIEGQEQHTILPAP